MNKSFTTYAGQIDKLKKDKNLIVSDVDYAITKLQDIGYYALIGGYKQPFIDSHTRKYIQGTTFEDVIALYEFDEELRGLVFQYLCHVERKIKSVISYRFTEEHGEKQAEYLNLENYNNTSGYAKGISKLTGILYFLANKSTEHDYIVYQRRKYHNVPLWVLMNALTFGQTSKMFELLPQNMQGIICRDFENVQKNDMIRYLKVMTLYRNVCAHNERLFSYRTYIDIPDTLLHEKLEIVQSGRKYKYGKNDLFGVVIVFKYLLPQKDLLQFKQRMVKITGKFSKNSKILPVNILLEYMGFPLNWTDITRYRKI